MNKIKFDFLTGMVKVDNQNLILGTHEDFIGSVFFSIFEKSLKKLGKYYYFLEDVEWEGEKFLIEIRPSINNFYPLIYFSRKCENGKNKKFGFKGSVNISCMHNEEIYLVDWLEKLQQKKGTYFSSTPSKTTWNYPWGNIMVQYNDKSFSCGIYIVWD